MLKNVKKVMSHYFEWMKFDLFVTISFIIAFALIFRFFDISSSYKGFFIFLLAMKSCMFGMNHALLPGANFTNDQFSWKFIQSLPLKRNEVVLSVVFTSFLSGLPFFIGLTFFYPELSDYLKLTSYPRSLVCLILISIILNFFAIKSLITNSRKQNNLIRKHMYTVFIRNGLIFLTSFLIASYVTKWIESEFSYDLSSKIYDSIKFAFNLMFTWWSILIFIVAGVYFYFNLMRIWRNESISYAKLIWNPRKEYSIISFCTLFLIVSYNLEDHKTPDSYNGVLQKMVFNKDYKSLERKLALNANINQANNYGMTPVSVAVNEGNLEMLKFLNSKKAKLEGVKYKDKFNKKVSDNLLTLAIKSNSPEVLEYLLSKGFKTDVDPDNLDFFPIHLAISECNYKMIDILIKNTDVNKLVNKSKETPILTAARAGCLSGAIALRDAGADFMLKNKDGKTAIELLNISKKKNKHSDFNNDILYFYQKNMRMPASVEIKK